MVIGTNFGGQRRSNTSSFPNQLHFGRYAARHTKFGNYDACLHTYFLVTLFKATACNTLVIFSSFEDGEITDFAFITSTYVKLHNRNS